MFPQFYCRIDIVRLKPVTKNFHKCFKVQLNFFRDIVVEIISHRLTRFYRPRWNTQHPKKPILVFVIGILKRTQKLFMKYQVE